MTVLGERHGARSDRVVLAQALRVFIVVLIVPFVFTAIVCTCRRLSAAQFAVGRRRPPGVARLRRRWLVGVLAKLGIRTHDARAPRVTVALTFGEVNPPRSDVAFQTRRNC